MKVKMLKTVKGSPNGIAVLVYEKGETYDVNNSLASCFLGDGHAVEEGAPENKSLNNAPENKGKKRKK